MEDVMEKNRRCTDILFLILFIAFMIGLFAAGIYGRRHTRARAFTSSHILRRKRMHSCAPRVETFQKKKK